MNTTSPIPVIATTAVFTIASLREVLGARRGSIPREIRQGRLKAHKRLGKYYILGEDVLEWIRGGTPAKAGVHAIVNGRSRRK
jgi:helix-turn-helix protein